MAEVTDWLPVRMNDVTMIMMTDGILTIDQTIVDDDGDNKKWHARQSGFDHHLPFC